MSQAERENQLLAQIRQLNRIGAMLSKERHLDRVLSAIVEESRRFYRCEGGSIFTRDEDGLVFRIAQNAVLGLVLTGQALAVSPSSIAGYVASTGAVLNIPDVYQIPEGAPYAFDPSFDQQNDYRTRSVLAVPLVDYDERVLGVLQLINPKSADERPIEFRLSDDDRGLLSSLASQAAIALSNALLVEEMKLSHLDTIFRLSVAAEYKDEDTAAHLERMSRYSETIARRLGLPEDTVEDIRLASPMHDVGKIGIPDAILMKPGRLTEHEFDVMKRHPEIGARILGGSRAPLLQMAEEIALNHHEKFNGQGYPRGLAGEDIPLVGRVVSLADVFDALTSRRCYKPAWSVERALEFVKKQRGQHFDPAVVDAFNDSLPTILQVRTRFQDAPEAEENTQVEASERG